LLLKALEKVKKVAIATCVIRNREHVFSLKPLEGNLLLMEQMRYVDEIKERPEVKDTAGAKITQQEVSLAVKLIEQLTEKFEPEKFKDTYIRELKKLAEAKASGKKITVAAEKKPAAVKDLMSVLKQSLEAGSHKKKKVA
jgi:DNA end-binding protein Ku